jgi:hypothetical protein
MKESEQELLKSFENKMEDALLEEAIDDRLHRLAKQGLIPKENVPKFRTAMDKMGEKKLPSIEERRILMNLLTSLIGMIMDNKEIYQRILRSVQKEKMKPKDETEDED